MEAGRCNPDHAQGSGGQHVTEAEALQKLRSYLLESIAQAADEIKEIDLVLLNSEVQECQ